nr:MAG: ORF1 [Torque teno midi virus]
MPFWWPRRRKWWSRRRFTYRRRPYKRRTRRNLYRKRYRRTTRRRRKRRKTKVRRKKPYLKLIQWQPQFIRKCKIIGHETLIRGANGKQFRDFTAAMFEWVAPTVPGGGGFSISTYNLQYLYEEYQLHHNIWTYSNTDFDLCRYTGCKIIFYRHPHTDFIAQYTISYPMSEDSHTGLTAHPTQLLLKKHHIIIPSRITKPYGKPYIKKKLKPPKQMMNKWFFMRDFAKTSLLLLKCTSADLNYVTLGRDSENNLTNINSLNITTFYTNGNFAQGEIATGYYKPIKSLSYSDKWITGKIGNTDKTFITNMKQNYNSSVNYDTGWFNFQILQSSKIIEPTMTDTAYWIGRYNPSHDTGKGNKAWLKSIFSEGWAPPTRDTFLITENEPLWLMFYGWLDYINTLKPTYNIFEQYTLVIQSPYIKKPKNQTYVVPIDDSFITGKNPYNSTYFGDTDKAKWIPVLKHQQQSINNLVKCGPFIPRPEGRLSNWELHCKYYFFFKWGGSTQTEQPILDPTMQSSYPDPNKLYKTIQISSPENQIPQSFLHNWDFRRDIVTKKAIKRMLQNLPDESTVSTDSEYHKPHKRQKVSSRQICTQKEKEEDLLCLQQLFKEDPIEHQEAKTQDDLQRLIQQQQEQQHQLKLNMLQLISNMKNKQLQIQLQAGIL